MRLKFDPSEDPVSPNAAFRQALLSVLQIRPRSLILQAGSDFAPDLSTDDDF